MKQENKMVKTIPPADRLFHGITKDQATSMISDAEERITNLMVHLHQKEEPLKEAQQLYMDAKQEYDAIEFKINCDKLILDSLSKYKNNLKSGAELRTLRASSH